MGPGGEYLILRMVMPPLSSFCTCLIVDDGRKCRLAQVGATLFLQQFTPPEVVAFRPELEVVDNNGCIRPSDLCQLSSFILLWRWFRYMHGPSQTNPRMPN
eukprot:scaffold425_cov175-Amphora_coffeaeformis.AAC.55